ncbi:MAG: AbrB/MazE/SpoVT family DNA-binding domain-containing protein [Nitrososphaerota archaeon]|jgi:bifunctional DNA-binding transcriptional regulator/antitoxin component of YhaV-PrlF toxin-antitoxin module|nr:AbrB/MazE/SpoVT family DNA-binding domain-containing protein [Nitrososphaerota archaeon]MDG6932702.1 AbrB/MazE/SpoVT family DNA-binding domain-containing protein [Nitrososphaerota archaeon]MDG6935512.1 AbrB/MazE/SpoVT family DNA-binding domain-containing protein [Nitrososphaerota archaeon]MDG6943407.1 AbrB/MazE/SpoVT family DNA-binding domain-containing protein [Nitrososphaerota archaeon]
MVSETKVTRANPRTTSLQAVIPMGIVEQMELKPGDILTWELMMNADGTKYVVVKKRQN